MGAPNHVRLLYHFTLRAELDRLVAAQRLPAEANVPTPWLRRALGRSFQVVWLSDLGELTPEQAAGRASVRPGLTAPADALARVTVSVADAQYWPPWADWRGIGKRQQRALDDAAGGLSGRWWIVSRDIPAAEWLAVDTTVARTVG